MVNPTGYTALDMIGFTDKDAYSSSANYVKNDLVHYGGNIWRCLIDDTSGIAPAEGVNWTLFIGEPTNLVERIIAPVETDPATNAWAVGRQIIFNDNLYEVITAITAGDSLVTYEDDPTNANIKLADPVETQLLNVKGNLSNRNLLDNAWFTVNQRGQSSYQQGNTYNYALDRWRIYNANVLLNTIGIDFAYYNSGSGSSKGILTQFIDNYESIIGKTVTLSILVNNEILTVTGVFPEKGGTDVRKSGGIVDLGLVFYSNRNYPQVTVGNTSATAVSIKAIKLELGSISTLAMDVEPNYQQELAKCQRYFVRVGSTSRIYLGTAVALDNDKATGVIKLPTTMRTLPTVTGITDLELSKGSFIAITALDNRDYNNGYLALTVSASGTTVGSCYLLRVKANSNIDFSADL